ncbi:response regulator transcription factor [Sphingobium sp. CECT 9361]|uniref:response regulator n=1 Tax=Sphingobium sp. CECT 9361 TaxID=2845384 RepID=UPI001E3CB42E|nr:response regulator transcription factor [Sphingobium sp. CECT 9361]
MREGRILLADDHPLIREGLQMAIRIRHPEYMVDVADTIAAAEDLARRRKPYKLLVLDYRLSDSIGFNGLFRMRHALSDTPIALLSAYTQPSIIATARALGAAGFLFKSQPLEELVRDIDMLLTGKQIFSSNIGVPANIADLNARLQSLSAAQSRVLSALASGHLNKQIAADLNLTEATVKAHLTSIFRKLGVTNRLQAMLAMRPLIDPYAESSL